MKKCILVFVMLLFSGVAIGQTVNDINWITEEYPPYNYVENNETKGIAVEVLLEMWKKVGVNKTASDINVWQWNRGVEITKTKPNSCLFATTLTAERKNLIGWKFVYPIPLTDATSSNHIIAKKSKGLVFNSIDDLKNYDGNFGVVKGDVGGGLLAEAGVSQNKLDESAGGNMLVKKFEKDRPEVVSYAFDTMVTKMEEEGIDSSQYEIVFTFPAAQMGYAFHHNTDDAIISKFQKALDELYADGIADKIVEKYRQ